jgi:hypothetical protein
VSVARVSQAESTDVFTLNAKTGFGRHRRPLKRLVMAIVSENAQQALGERAWVCHPGPRRGRSGH